MNPIRNMRRASAAAWHLAISATIAAALFAGIYLLWYPGDLFEVGGGRRLFLLIAGVHMVLGPLITLIIFDPGKKALLFDLIAIATLQAGALLFGVWVLFASRPVYIVFVKDRFELMRANGYPEAELARAGSSPYLVFPLAGPRIVGARMPTDRAERERIVFLAPGGVDLQHMLQHYVAYDRERPAAAAKAKPISQLRNLNPGKLERIDRLVRDLGRDEKALGFLPMRAESDDLAVIVDFASGDVLRLVALNPWES